MARAKNFFDLMAYVIEGVSASEFANTAFAYYGMTDDGNLDRTMVETAIGMGEAFGPDDAISCGLTANAFSLLFTGQKKPEVECSLADLKRRIQDACPRIIRLDSSNHSYVIEQVDTRGTPSPLLGNVYQSNVGVIGEHAEDENKLIQNRGITTLAYLQEKPNPVPLEAYLAAVGTVVEKKKSLEERFEIYKAAYIVPSFSGRDKVTLTAFRKAEDKGKFAFKFRHQTFSEQYAMEKIASFLQVANPLLVGQARLIYRDLPIGPGGD